MIVILLFLILVSIVLPGLISSLLAGIFAMTGIVIAGAAMTPSQPIDWLAKGQSVCDRVNEGIESQGRKMTPAHYLYTSCKELNDETKSIEKRRKYAEWIRLGAS